MSTTDSLATHKTRPAEADKKLINWRTVALYAGLALFLFAVLAPFYWILKSALSRPEQLFEIPPVYLPDVTFENFTTLADQVPLWAYIRNSIVFSGTTALLSVGLAFMAAYAFARINIPGKNILLWLFVLTMALPEIATVIPLYLWV